MWKPSQTGSSIPNSAPEPQHAAPPAHVPETPSRTQAGNIEQATLGKGLFIKGEITGSESLYIDGKVEGAINLPGNRVTIGRNGQVAANITAREVVVLGKVKGNVSATDRVDIRAEGSLNGDVSAARISIEDGAFFKGGIDIRKPDAKPVARNRHDGPGRSSRADAGDTRSAQTRRGCRGRVSTTGDAFSQAQIRTATSASASAGAFVSFCAAG